MGFFWSQITELLIGCWLFEFGANGTKWNAEDWFLREGKHDLTLE